MTAMQEAQRVELLRLEEKNVVYAYNPRKRVSENSNNGSKTKNNNNQNIKKKKKK